MTGTIWLGAGCSYNKFTTQEEAIKAQWAQVENQLQRRNDLIPNLVETVKGFAQQEQDVFQAVADARAKMAGAQTPAEKIAAANAESSALARLLVVVENYPQLKSDAQFAAADGRARGHREPAGDRAHALQRDGAGVQHVARGSFPSNITAKMFGFKEYPYFEAPADAKARAEGGLRRVRRRSRLVHDAEGLAAAGVRPRDGVTRRVLERLPEDGVRVEAAREVVRARRPGDAPRAAPALGHGDPRLRRATTSPNANGQPADEPRDARRGARDVRSARRRGPARAGRTAPTPSSRRPGR